MIESSSTKQEPCILYEYIKRKISGKRANIFQAADCKEKTAAKSRKVQTMQGSDFCRGAKKRGVVQEMQAILCQEGGDLVQKLQEEELFQQEQGSVPVMS